ncbi:MAG: 6-carboxytetrahydropterin synthase QueD [Desulfonauticus sp.]|nr:6-carboxytetrahydropterin synthase QueD [Desulfonauticus sp.]
MSFVYRLRIRDKFSSAHYLRNYNGKCESLHGHNFKVEVEVYGQKLSQDTEILIDFKELKKMLKKILEDLDHTLLNDLDYFRVSNPSSENIAAYIYKKLKSKLPASVQLKYVMVAESDTSMAFVEEE